MNNKTNIEEDIKEINVIITTIRKILGKNIKITDEDVYKIDGRQYIAIENILKEYKGRIWLIHAADMWIYNVIPKENIKVLKDLKQIYTSYHEYSYGIMLLEKY